MRRGVFINVTLSETHGRLSYRRYCEHLIAWRCLNDPASFLVLVPNEDVVSPYRPFLSRVEQVLLIWVTSRYLLTTVSQVNWMVASSVRLFLLLGYEQTLFESLVLKSESRHLIFYLISFVILMLMRFCWQCLLLNLERHVKSSADCGSIVSEYLLLVVVILLLLWTRSCLL